MSYRPNPFFAATTPFFAQSVGDKIDRAVDKAQLYKQEAEVKAQQLYNQSDLKSKGEELLGKADNKLQDAKEAVKTTAKPPPTGVDLYAR
jgi:4-diphosphocytidyl-2C-methyl-D-erythritol kinase